MSQTTAPKAVEGTLGFIDERLGSTSFFRRNVKKVFPDHWSFMLGEIALYSFVILLLTGTFLTFWFKPSMTEVVYDGSYTNLQGVAMSEAYASTLHISFDVRGGLLMRQIHHWSAILFMASLVAHMLRVFFTGAYRKPRELNWLIGLGMFTLGIVEGLFGYSLPDDLLSGTGLRITQGVAESIPVVGTYLYMFLFGGEFPGQDIIPRLYMLHILLIPALLLGLITAHMMIMWHQKHTAMPVKHQTEKQVYGYPFYPVFMAKTGAYFLFVFGVTALFGAFLQINPVWLYGPYDPGAISSGSQPDWYMGFLEGSLRIMPAWEINAWGHTLSLSVLIPAALPLGIIMTGAAVWPFVEQWVTGDKRQHHVNDRPRNAPVRTSIGMAAVTFYGLLWLAGANDILAERFDISLFATTWFFRVTIFVGPVLAYIITKRICLGLQRKDAESVAHGVESGVIVMSPEGGFSERHEPARDEEMHVLLSKEKVRPAAPEKDAQGIPAAKGPLGHLRSRLNRAWTIDDIPVEAPAHGEPEKGEQEAIESGKGSEAKR
ncbi:menaquinol-cytochrome c reductase cytochrome b subunit precursor [Actinomadura hallensis]|uniref:Cytochrome bc1 complex cytochrome b subunit n=1 Tax=Actinomadura hallensis TaxID=337895 RepID=A0A543IHU0_9ACTN|nr:ubiquinol-cytochrome c reductase cytochrome b subunit [Actinomadura hallensis]TQM70146.1 menaquinol-cytochrome c reductase cytochrome b subunit precursor [Actinomadura hallensis]HLV72587.1 ubiquinol-cytochrome c reductase cytochrome b subunit [Vulgatibacteraceae bacterium]